MMKMKMAASLALAAMAVSGAANTQTIPREHIQMCREAAIDRANSEADQATQPAVWQDLMGMYFTDCLDTYWHNRYRPGEGACFKFPCR